RKGRVRRCAIGFVWKHGRSSAVNRRDFITLLGGAAAWPLAAGAQQGPVVGFLSSLAPSDAGHVMPAFHDGLNHTGLEGRNVAIEYRWAAGDYRRLPALPAPLVNPKVTAIPPISAPPPPTPP